MDIASALLTKKAALIGGGTAATATAVTVPIVVTQNKNNDESSQTKVRSERSVDGGGESQQNDEEVLTGDIETPTINDLAVLDLEGDDFYKNFNKPGYCLKKLFPGVERSSFFKDERDYQEAPESVTLSKIFNEEEITNGCYAFNKETQDKGKQRIELMAQSETEGWLWMTGLKEVDSHQKLWYKEAYLKKSGEEWKVVVGQEGEITNKDGYKPTLPNYDGNNSKFKEVKEVDRETREECSTQQTNKCQTHKARVGYWNGDSGSTNKFMNTDHNASGDHITRWSGKKHKIWATENRKHIFIKGKWHNNTKATQEEKQKLIHVEDTKVPTKPGDWKDLSALCRGSANSNAPYITYCTKAS